MELDEEKKATMVSNLMVVLCGENGAQPVLNTGTLYNNIQRSIVSAKKNFVLRIDEDTFKALEKWASDEFRSVNGQVEWLIDKALKDKKRSKKADDKADKTEPDSKPE